MFLHNTNVVNRLKRNLDVSVIMPYYKKFTEFSININTNAPFLQRNGIEVILAMDDPSEQSQLLDLIKQYPLINWKIFINRTSHPWRNPSKAINVGIRNASKKFILVMGPDSEMFTDIILKMRYLAEFYPDSFFTGHVAFCEQFQKTDADTLQKQLMPYGSIMAARKGFLDIRGYDESYIQWGGDDDNIRARFGLIGLSRISLSDAILIHREPGNTKGHEGRTQRSKAIPAAQRKLIFYPSSPVTNTKKWGTDFSENIYDYTQNVHAALLLNHYLATHTTKFQMPVAAVLEKKYKIIALLPVYNEKKHMPAIITHLQKYCDGIILLDDSSTDGTYELAKGRKLLVKAQKPRGPIFNDLQNRNMLLDMASFFKADWFIFMDADERFDSRWGLKINEKDLQKCETICFYLVHLWNKPDRYRSDGDTIKGIPKGILLRWRMFKNKGRMQLLYKRKLHFTTIPYLENRHTKISNTLIKHYGMLNEELRSAKSTFYKKEDEKWKFFQFEYDLLTEKETLTKPLRSINIKKLSKKINWEL